MRRGKSHRTKRGWVGTGEFQNSWALTLRDEIERSVLPVVVPDPGTEHGRKLVRALGAKIEDEDVDE